MGNPNVRSNPMLRKGMLFVAALGLVATAPSVRADICFQYGTGGGAAVARGATIPARNACVPLALFEADDPQRNGRGGALTGSLCKDWNNNTLLYHYTYDACTAPGSYFESATCSVQLSTGDLPSQSSSCRGIWIGLDSNQAGPAHQFTDGT